MDCIALKDRKLNCVRFYPSESYSHALKKFEICYYLRKRGIGFYTEVNFTPPYSGRADILVMSSPPFIVEVLESERELKQSKRKNYPYEVVPVKAHIQFLPEVLE